jgi:hypothetical protein
MNKNNLNKYTHTTKQIHTHYKTNTHTHYKTNIHTHTIQNKNDEQQGFHQYTEGAPKCSRRNRKQ